MLINLSLPLKVLLHSLMRFRMKMALGKILPVSLILVDLLMNYLASQPR